MKHISILVPEGAHLGSLVGAHQLLNEANNCLKDVGRSPMFNVHLVGLSAETRLNDGIFAIFPDHTIDEITHTDLVIVPAVGGNPTEAIERNKGFVPWMIRQREQGAEIASLCVGAFLLAATGLLNGKKTSTHWMSARNFREMFPEVELVADQIITDEQGLYSSGGAYSYLNLMLYLIEKFAGRDIAVYCAKVFAIEIERKSQSPFMMFKGQKDHEDEPVKKAQEFIEQNFQEKITVDQLASMFALSRRNLERRFKKATANTVAEYIQRVKIEAAKFSLESSQENVSEVMYNVGYTDSKAFRTTFKKIAGLSPAEYRNKYNRMALA